MCVCVVAGHGKILQQDSVLLKPTVHYEAEFYEQVGDRLPRLMPFIPKYFGRKIQPDSKTDIHLAPLSLCLSACARVRACACSVFVSLHLWCVQTDIGGGGGRDGREGTCASDVDMCVLLLDSRRCGATQFIVLEDVTRDFHKPCVMDIKMGTTLFPDWCPEAKKLQRIEMAAKTTTGSIGIRICGMNVRLGRVHRWVVRGGGGEMGRCGEHACGCTPSVGLCVDCIHWLTDLVPWRGFPPRSLPLARRSIGQSCRPGSSTRAATANR